MVAPAYCVFSPRLYFLVLPRDLPAILDVYGWVEMKGSSRRQRVNYHTLNLTILIISNQNGVFLSTLHRPFSQNILGDSSGLHAQSINALITKVREMLVAQKSLALKLPLTVLHPHFKDFVQVCAFTSSLTVASWRRFKNRPIYLNLGWRTQTHRAATSCYLVNFQMIMDFYAPSPSLSLH